VGNGDSSRPAHRPARSAALATHALLFVSSTRGRTKRAACVSGHNRPLVSKKAWTDDSRAQVSRANRSINCVPTHRAKSLSPSASNKPSHHVSSKRALTRSATCSLRIGHDDVRRLAAAADTSSSQGVSCCPSGIPFVVRLLARHNCPAAATSIAITSTKAHRTPLPVTGLFFDCGGSVALLEAVTRTLTTTTAQVLSASMALLHSIGWRTARASRL
jgi:hypothetical protein